MSLRLKLLLFISALFLTAILNVLFYFQLQKFGDEKLRWVNHTHDVIIETVALLGAIKDSETGQRGYLLTNDVSYLEPYHAGITNAKEALGKLEKLISDNPDQQDRLKSIQSYMELKFAELRQTIELKEKKQHTKVLEIVKQDKGKQIMDTIREISHVFIDQEKILLEVRKGDLKAVRVQIETLLFVEISIFIILAILTILFLNKNLFDPLHLLLSSTHKMEKGGKVDIKDVLPNDEMGFLLSSFFKMNQKVYARTEVLTYKAHHDELTGLLNRSNVFQDIQSSINNTLIDKTKVGILFIDLNKFKTLNDTYGHDIGDGILKESAKRLADSIRKDDTVYRIGGDEFIVLINSLKNVSTAEQIISKILNSFVKPILIGKETIQISLSIGVAIAPDNSDHPEELVKMADVAMYSVKSDSKISFKFFEKEMLKRSSDLS